MTTDNEVPQAIIERDEQLARMRKAMPQIVDTRPALTMLRDALISEIMRSHECDRAAAERMFATVSREEKLDPAELARQREIERAEREAGRISRILGELEFSSVDDALIEDIVRGKLAMTSCASEAREWLRSQRKWLLLLGDIGTGKTVAACAAAVAFIRAHKTVAYIRETTLVKLWASGTVTHEERWRSLTKVDLLVIDELGLTETVHADRAGIAVWEMFDARTRTGHTIGAGNLTLEQFGRRYGTRMIDRMRQHGRIHEAKLDEGQRSMRTREAPLRTEAAQEARAAVALVQDGESLRRERASDEGQGARLEG